MNEQSIAQIVNEIMSEVKNAAMRIEDVDNPHGPSYLLHERTIMIFLNGAVMKGIESERDYLTSRFSIKKMLDSWYIPPDVCKWQYVESHEFYETECGHTWQFADGTPGDNGAVFCMHCGRRIETAVKEE